ncbi:MAG: response regulator transcription factor [Bryobacteraceae bacterium]|nr:response regulator transcription factor [Bryobacteraceae bacterium]MDW8377161.1 response regulator transcription factor [Bryobacterales bacterium]
MNESNLNARPVSLLLVDDDVELCGLMKDFFEEQGIQVQIANDGRAGLAKALSGQFDLVLLDVMLPALDGFQVLREIRRQSSVPVIMLTARIERPDRVAGLEGGADDYLPKPFDPDELLARIRAVLRRVDPNRRPAAAPVRVGPLEVNSANQSAHLAGKRIELTAMEFHILDVLARAAGRVVSRDEISTVLYQREATAYERSLDVHISHLRKKIEGPGAPVIKTVRGVGYCLTTAEPA